MDQQILPFAEPIFAPVEWASHHQELLDQELLDYSEALARPLHHRIRRSSPQPVMKPPALVAILCHHDRPNRPSNCAKWSAFVNGRTESDNTVCRAG